jgi:hypothetical protein
MWVERDEERIGVYGTELRRREDGQGYLLEAAARLAIPIFGADVAFGLDARVAMSERFEMRTFQGRIEMGPEGSDRGLAQSLAIEGFVEGLDLYCRVEGPPLFVPGGSRTWVLLLDRPVVLADAIIPIVAGGGKLRPGRRWTTEASDPIGGRLAMRVSVEVHERETIRVGDGEAEAFRVVERSGDRQVTSWYTPEGELLRTDLGGGMTLRRADDREARLYHRERGLAPPFPEIDRARLRAEAVQVEASAESLLPWMPEL